MAASLVGVGLLAALIPGSAAEESGVAGAPGPTAWYQDGRESWLEEITLERVK